MMKLTHRLKLDGWEICHQKTSPAGYKNYNMQTEDHVAMAKAWGLLIVDIVQVELLHIVQGCQEQKEDKVLKKRFLNNFFQVFFF